MSTGVRVLILSAALLMIFGAATAIVLRLMPGPHTDTDYLVIGAIATFVALLALFVVLITTWVKAPDVFYKKRRD